MSAKNLAWLIVGAVLTLLTLAMFVKPPVDPTTPPKQPDPALGGQPVSVYFAKNMGQQVKIIGLKRQFPMDDNWVLPEYRVKWVVKKLLAGPTPYEVKMGYYSEIPEDTGLQGVSGQDNKLYLNLSREFTQGSGSETLLNRLEQLKKTLEAIPNNPYPIYLKVDGQLLTVLGGEGLDVEQPIAKGSAQSNVAAQP